MTSKRIILVCVILLVTLSQFATGIYLPSMPAMVTALHTDKAHIQLTVTVMMIAFGIAQLIYGAFSDYYGRRLMVMIGVGIFFAGTLVCVLASTINLLLLGRIIQGAGIGCSGAVGRSIIRDLTSSNVTLMKAMAYVSMALAITPVCGPLIGGYLQHYFDWRMNFIFLLGFTVVVYCLLFRFLPETNTQCHQHPISIKNIFRHYQFVLSHRLFLGATLCGALVFAGEITYILMAPFIFQTSLGLNALQFGWLALFMVLSMMMGSYMSTKLSHKLPINTLIWMGLLTALLGALSLLLLGLINIFTVTSVLIPMMISMLGLGIVYPNASALAVIHFTQHAGIAAALYGAVAMAGTGLYSVWVTGFHVHNQIPLALLLLITNLLAFLTYYVWIVPHKLPIQSENS